MRSKVHLIRRAVTKLVHEEVAMARFRSDYDEGKISGQDLQWQSNNVTRARESFNRKMEVLREELEQVG